jgi:hypothetical protein
MRRAELSFSRTFSAVSCLALAFVVACRPTTGRAETPAVRKAERVFEQAIRLDALGNGEVRLEWTLPPAEFVRLVALLGRTTHVPGKDGRPDTLARVAPGSANLVHFLNLENLSLVVEGARMTIDQSRHRLAATLNVPGWARTSGAGRWFVEVLDNARWYDLLESSAPPLAGTLDFEADKGAGTDTAVYVSRQTVGAVTHSARLRITLPRAARQPKLVKRPNGRWAVTYRLAAPATGKRESADPEYQVLPRGEVVPAIHKLYGDPAWSTLALARINLGNPGSEVLRDLRVRARVATSLGKTGWTEWEQIAAVVYPGQSVQYPLHPVLDAAALMVESRENGRLHVEFEHTRPDKEKVRHDVQATLTVLGRNDTPFTNLDLRKVPDATFRHRFQDLPLTVTAFVTPNDPVIKDLKGRLSAFIGGRATRGSAAAARRYAKAVYDFFRANIAYSSPTTEQTADGRPAQHFNYPRDVLKAGTGTCVDLAITFASLAEAAGLEAGVMLIPGHALPFVFLPNTSPRQFLVVETTLCGRGSLDGSSSFQDAAAKGLATYVNAERHGQFVFAKLRLLRKHISAPELPAPAAANPLDAWGRKLPPANPEVSLGAIALKHNILRGERLGMEVYVPVSVTNSRGHGCALVVQLTDAAGKPFTDARKRNLLVKAALPTPKADKTELTTYKVFYPYAATPYPADGHWRELGLLVDVWSDLYRETIAGPGYRERFFLQRPAPTQKEPRPMPQCFRVQTAKTNRGAGTPGYFLLVKDTQVKGAADADVSLQARVVDYDKFTDLKDPDGKKLVLSAKGKVGNFFFSEAQIAGVVPLKANGFGLALNLWDKKTSSFLLPQAVVVKVHK